MGKRLAAGSELGDYFFLYLSCSHCRMLNPFIGYPIGAQGFQGQGYTSQGPTGFKGQPSQTSQGFTGFQAYISILQSIWLYR